MVNGGAGLRDARSNSEPHLSNSNCRDAGPLAFAVRAEIRVSSLWHSLRMQHHLRYETKLHPIPAREIISPIFILAVLLFLAVAIFGGQCWRRDWLMYPVFNYLSWSYGFACLACLFHGLGASFIYMVRQHNSICFHLAKFHGFFFIAGR